MQIEVKKRDGRIEPLIIEKIHAVTSYACEGLDISASEIELGSQIMFFDGITTDQIHSALIKAAAELISPDKPEYSRAAARLVRQRIYKEAAGAIKYPTLLSYVRRAVQAELLRPDMLEFDMLALDAAIDPDRDDQFQYLGIQTLYDRYLIRKAPRRDQTKGDLLEMPQHFWMRVAMGLALNEKPENRTRMAISFYNVLSCFEFICSTPTLFNSGTLHMQMSSCYLNTVADSIGDLGDTTGIFNTVTECANLSKFAGGIGTDWTRVRPAGDVIKGTGGKSSGIVPYLKIFNDTAVAVNQGGKRNGAFAAYLEPWHPDVERFIDLKKNAGDERMRAREIFTSGWFPDLFFERVEANEKWSLISPCEHPDLHELYGDEFKDRYEQIEAAGGAVKTVQAQELWRSWLTAMWESGGPWITFKDECNRRNPQEHIGVIHNSNLCTEITLNTSDDETAVCNLGSINMGRLEVSDFNRVVPIAIRMLDNVIDLNFYPVEKARESNMRHRPIGLGLMGWSEFLARHKVDWESKQHLKLTDQVFEHLSHYAIFGSAMLAAERGPYPSYRGSKWQRGEMPMDHARDLPGLFSAPSLDWRGLKEFVQENGMRNSNVMAIAPTATISNIVGTTPCIEPSFKLHYTQENHSGTFTTVDPAYLVWDRAKTAFEVDQRWVLEAAAVRQRWIDQAQSVNLFAAEGTRGRDLSEWYMQAWKLGLKTTYYLKRQIKELDHREVIRDQIESLPEPEGALCSIDNPDCESCQ